MLSERQLEELLKIFEERWSAIVTEYLTQMGDHLAEIGELLPSDANRIIEMRRMGVNLKRIQNQIAFAASQSAEDVMKVLEAVANSDARFMQRVLKLPEAPLSSQALRRALLAQYEVTLGEMANLARTTVVSDAYKDAVDVAVQSVQGGVSNYTQAIRRTVEAAASEGLRVKYGSGRTMRLDSAARMNVLDGVRSLQQAALFAIGEEFGADGVELSAHALCAEDHLPYQGLQYSMKGFEELQDSLARPIGKWNCKHVAHPIILGVSEPAHDAQDLQELEEQSNRKVTIDGKTLTRYQWTQQQRRVETAVRYQKDRANLAKHAGDDVVRRDAQAKINKLYDYYDRISDKAELSARYGRTYVAGFRTVKVKEALPNVPKSDIVKKTKKAGTDGVNTICKIDRSVYSCISKNITSDEVVITNERISHVKDHHPDDYERYGHFIPSIIEKPHYIIATDRANTAFVLKEFKEDGKQFRLILRLATTEDETGMKNSVITFQYVKAKEYRRLIRNKEILYKDADL